MINKSHEKYAAGSAVILRYEAKGEKGKNTPIIIMTVVSIRTGLDARL